MSFHRSAAWLVFAVGLLTAIALERPDGGNAKANPVGPLYFMSIAEAVQSAGQLLADRDWATLSRYYDLSLTPGVTGTRLLDGSFFIDLAPSAAGPRAVTRYLQPFAPGAKLIEAKALGDQASLPCVWSVTTALAIEQGGGPVQRVVGDCRLLQTKDGFRFLPPAPTESMRPPSPVPAATQSERVGDELILRYRPGLRARADKELPAGRSSNIPALVQAVERLKLIAAAQPGRVRRATQPWEPPNIFDPTDEELLLSLAGDRIWRSVQLAPPGMLTRLRTENPGFTYQTIEYPHVEIVRVDAAGSGPRLYAKPLEFRRMNLTETPP